MQELYPISNSVQNEDTIEELDLVTTHRGYFTDGSMNLKTAHGFVLQVMHLLELIPWNDDIKKDSPTSASDIYPGVDEELQAAYEHLDEAEGVLNRLLKEIEDLNQDNL